MDRKKRLLDWYVVLGTLLVVLSAMLYLLHYAVFRDTRHIFIYMLGDLAFLPVEVLLVTIVLHRLLEVREKRTRLQKMNMVIGTFFSEVGTSLLEELSRLDLRCDLLESELRLARDWSDEDFERVERTLPDHFIERVRAEKKLEELRDFLLSKRDFLLTLLENPNLLEHESFTDLLWAVFHLAEELRFRSILDELPEKDREHLCGDIDRVYRLLVREWLRYVKHLKEEYPYLYSLVTRTNPFNPEASPVIS
jgi:hypothetical protein